MPVLLGFLSSIFWGAGDFAGGISSRRIGAMRAVLYADGAGILFLLAGLLVFPEPIPAISSLLLAALAGLAGSLGLLCMYRAMETGSMSIAAPVSALLAAALPVLVGAVTQGLPGALQIAGFALALAAVWFVSQEDGARLHIERLSDLRLPLLAGVGFGTYFVVIHSAAQTATIWPMIASRLAGTVLLTVVVLSRRESLSIPSRAWGLVALNAGLDVGGNVFYVIASQIGRLDVSAVLSSLYPGVTVLLAWLLLKERINRTQVFGIILALAAIVLMTL